MKFASSAAFVVCACAVAFTSASPALAQQRRDPAAAEVLFRQAKEALRKGDLPTACAQFAASHELDPAPGTLLNLADCEERRGHVATARQLFVDAASILPAGDPRVAFADQRATALKPRVSTLEVRATVTPGMRLTRDDVPLGAAALGVALPVDPGPHKVVVTAPGQSSRTIDVSLAEGEHRVLTVDAPESAQPAKAAVSNAPAPAPAPAPAAASAASSAPAPGPQTTRRTLGFAAGGAGVVALGVGVVTGIMTASAASTYKSNCSSDGSCSPEGLSAADRGKLTGVISPVAFLLGAAGVGVGAYLVLTSSPKGVRVGAAPSPHGASAALVANF